MPHGQPRQNNHVGPCLACRVLTGRGKMLAEMDLHGAVRYSQQEMEIMPLATNRGDMPSTAVPPLSWVSAPIQQQHLRPLQESANSAALVHRLSITNFRG